MKQRWKIVAVIAVMSCVMIGCAQEGDSKKSEKVDKEEVVSQAKEILENVEEKEEGEQVKEKSEDTTTAPSTTKPESSNVEGEGSSERSKPEETTPKPKPEVSQSASKSESEKPAPEPPKPVEVQPEPEPPKPVEPEPPKPVEPEPEPEPPKPVESQFDVNQWVSYGKNYATSIGLSLNSEATGSWDNPISASATNNPEQDIISRLNRYKNIEGFTMVWIWAEKTSDTTWQIYIGYA